MTFRCLDVACGHYLHSPWALPMVGMGWLRREGTQRSELLESGASTFRSSGAWSGWGGRGRRGQSCCRVEPPPSVVQEPGLAGGTQPPGLPWRGCCSCLKASGEIPYTGVECKGEKSKVCRRPMKSGQIKGSRDGELKPALLIWLTNTSWVPVVCPQCAKVQVDDGENVNKRRPLCPQGAYW